MQFVTYHPTTGRIDAVRSASGCRTPEALLAVVYGPNADLWRAIPYAGDDLTGLMVDPVSGSLVPDPAYVPPPAPVSLSQDTAG